MNQTSYSPDKFGTYLSHPGSQGCDISCTLVPSQITDIFYANFIQWAHENFERNMFGIIQKKTGNKSMKTFERYITFDED